MIRRDLPFRSSLIQPPHHRKVDAEEFVGFSAHVEAGAAGLFFALALLLLAVLWHRLFFWIDLGREGHHQLLDLFVTLVDLLPMTAVKRQPLPQHDDLCPVPVAFQRLAEGLFAGFHVRVSHPGQYRGIPLAGNYFTLEVITAAGADGAKVTYEIFFTAYLAARRSAVTLNVQSAYIRDRAHSNRPHTKVIGFAIILHNVLNRKEIKVPQ